QAARATTVVAKNRMRDHRCRRAAVVRIDHHVDSVAHQHLQCTLESWFGERVRIESHIKRSIHALHFAVKAYRLRYREYMRLVEGIAERAAAMPRGSKCYALGGHGRIWLLVIISGSEPGDVDQNRRQRRFSRHRTHFHILSSTVPGSSFIYRTRHRRPKSTFSF